MYSCNIILVRVSAFSGSPVVAARGGENVYEHDLTKQVTIAQATAAMNGFNSIIAGMQT